MEINKRKLMLTFTNFPLFSLQGTRMEERLDDAINVLRSHCEQPLNMPIGSGMEAPIGSFANVPTQPQSSDALSQEQMPQDASISLPIALPVKIERPSVPSASSKFYFYSLFYKSDNNDYFEL